MILSALAGSALAVHLTPHASHSCSVTHSSPTAYRATLHHPHTHNTCKRQLRWALWQLTHASRVQGTLECELPNASLYTFTGNLRLEQPGQDPAAQATLPLSQASVLLRGCSLRNTGHILGAVIFAGHESKVSSFRGWGCQQRQACC